MSTPRRSNAEIKFSEDKDETESASVIRHVVSHDGHKEASELVNTVNFPAVAIETQRDFLTSIHAEVARLLVFPFLLALLGGGSVGCGLFVPFCLLRHFLFSFRLLSS